MNILQGARSWSHDESSKKYARLQQLAEASRAKQERMQHLAEDRTAETVKAGYLRKARNGGSSSASGGAAGRAAASQAASQASQASRAVPEHASGNVSFPGSAADDPEPRQLQSRGYVAPQSPYSATQKFAASDKSRPATAGATTGKSAKSAKSSTGRLPSVSPSPKKGGYKEVAAQRRERERPASSGPVLSGKGTGLKDWQDAFHSDSKTKQADMAYCFGSFFCGGVLFASVGGVIVKFTSSDQSSSRKSTYSRRRMWHYDQQSTDVGVVFPLWRSRNKDAVRCKLAAIKKRRREQARLALHGEVVASFRKHCDGIATGLAMWI